MFLIQGKPVKSLYAYVFKNENLILTWLYFKYNFLMQYKEANLLL